MRTQKDWDKLLQNQLHNRTWRGVAEFVLGDLTGYRHGLTGEESDTKSLTNLLELLADGNFKDD